MATAKPKPSVRDGYWDAAKGRLMVLTLHGHDGRAGKGTADGARDRRRGEGEGREARDGRHGIGGVGGQTRVAVL